MIRRPPRSTLSSSSAASDVYKRQVPVGGAPSLRTTTETGTGVPCVTLCGTFAWMWDTACGACTARSTTWARSPAALCVCSTSRSVSVASGDRCTMTSAPGWPRYHRLSSMVVGSDSNHTGGSNGSTVNGSVSSTMPLGVSAYAEYIATTNVGWSPGVMPTFAIVIGTTSTLLSNTEVSSEPESPLASQMSSMGPKE